MFRCSSDEIKLFTKVLGFIRKLAYVSHKAFNRMFPNQKPWVDKTIHNALRSYNIAYNVELTTGKMDEYKAVSCDKHRAMEPGKWCYGRKLESQIQQGGSRGLWQGLRMIDYKTPSFIMVNADAPLVDELNTFYTYFEDTANSTNSASFANIISSAHSINTANGNMYVESEQETHSISEHDVSKAFRKMNTWKAV